ncbi:MBL fold metallo-hydrolase [Corynebacterium jeikeium]|uniref:MBL fold metallo-hydrolase n=1 Tax=Corynebacterium jeikeium TaxID=38289 RepID=UPI0001B717D3|nr:MBL fold metallo-hydrolase [Corynebacterium jeikeium]EEW17141.1 metallo-beta-lactamase domain protein [Corynebacterium jeikeium ATCC 43734]OOD29577.1 MBL fold hydrolase [Corynebacterium jeikeium]WCZ53399.1 putative metallo-hydrolase [Corynebacterium jeikeium]SQI21699.1 Metallo-beta-lactamase superfamily protein [Corynebacterium jeikeium]SUY81289.1 Metallo-beta-lactamase superfamily protein [Corynebacterium jeikeium]
MQQVTEFSHLSAPRDVQVLSSDAHTYAVTTVGSMDNNCWLLCRGGEALLVDAADDSEHLLDLAEQLGVRITDVLTTHQHADHTRALADVLKATGARHHGPRLDAEALPVAPDRVYGNDEGSLESLDLAGAQLPGLGLQVVELRGHTPGGLAVLDLADGRVPRAWVGDSVFPGGVGKTNSSEQFQQLLGDVRDRIFTLPDETRIHPGHGDSTSVGEEKGKVDEWAARGW